jgi:hypothetical protein
VVETNGASSSLSLKALGSSGFYVPGNPKLTAGQSACSAGETCEKGELGIRQMTASGLLMLTSNPTHTLRHFR